MKLNLETADITQELRVCKRKMASLSLARILLFFSILALAIVGLTEIRWLMLVFFPMCGLFIYLILLFNLQKDRLSFLQMVAKMEEESSWRKDRKLREFEPGEEFKDKHHPFCNDLDLFGEHSLFQLLNHTVGEGGKKLLATWMKSPVDPEQAKRRFSAVKELSGFTAFLRNFEAIGKAFIKEERSKDPFYGWLKTPGEWKGFYWIPMVAGPLGGIAFLVGWLYLGWSLGYLLLWILVGLGFLGFIFKPLLAAYKRMPDEGDLKTLTIWARELEELDFEDPYLRELQQPILEGKYRASAALRSLEQRSFMIQNRVNMMYMVFNLLFWVDFVVLFSLEQWKRKHADKVQRWEFVFQEWQVMVSLAAFTQEEKLDCQINWSREKVLNVKGLKHPLLLQKACVANDFSLTKDDKTILLTGSNMSGKTTFMRTVGINMVLANLGVSPYARSFESGAFWLFTSMRNTDNLGESVSSFYAELARIKSLLDQAEKQYPVFYLLDEILKGTNTTDRVMGSEALIRQLTDSQSKGIISTHDIELAELADKIPSLLNYSFHSDIKDNEILFDYKIKNGPCPSFNAHKLMELMGIRF
ncbi:DNA mismatch repair protein [Echinicola strongylocentroti]|uniref:DNA mismatch repair protein n=1 Tax=Echinicola strongylocentroti TaxID=1795355 RepID=A0A2Z4IJI5_9BACT|nr:DNA mismatch repair protein [Echinicola strongylocentroti]AWW30688.1 DNA mismatch repair protein [Echinicola strongylocentroti]